MVHEHIICLKRKLFRISEIFRTSDINHLLDLRVSNVTFSQIFRSILSSCKRRFRLSDNICMMISLTSNICLIIQSTSAYSICAFRNLSMH